MISDRLLDLADCVGDGDPDAGDRVLVETLEGNPGTVHSLFELETALCAAHDCCGLERETPPTCPPDYEDIGAACSGPGGHLVRHYRL